MSLTPFWLLSARLTFTQEHRAKCAFTLGAGLLIQQIKWKYVKNRSEFMYRPHVLMVWYEKGPIMFSDFIPQPKQPYRISILVKTLLTLII